MPEIRVKCPWCWHKVSPHEFLWISVHHKLRRDEILGDDANSRFLPNHYSPAGRALDQEGEECTELACPRCRLEIPRVLLTQTPFIISCLGAPASGKASFLAASCWLLEAVWRQLGIPWMHASPSWNRRLMGYTQSLFHPIDAVPHVTLPKTREKSELYRTGIIAGQPAQLLQPFVFQLGSRPVLIYEGTGGPWFNFTSDDWDTETRHLLHADTVFFLFDPLQNASFRDEVSRRVGVPIEVGHHGHDESAAILLEAGARLRKLMAISPLEKPLHQLIVVVMKSDVWSALLNDDAVVEPVSVERASSLSEALDMDRISRVSEQLRALLFRHAPELATTASSLAGSTLFVPVSALGPNAKVDAETGHVRISPCDIRPSWAEVPFLYALASSKAIEVPEQKPAPGSALSPVWETCEKEMFAGDQHSESNCLNWFRAVSNIQAPLRVRLLALRKVKSEGSANPDPTKQLKAYEQARLNQVSRDTINSSHEFGSVIAELSDPRWSTPLSQQLKSQLVQNAIRICVPDLIKQAQPLLARWQNMTVEIADVELLRANSTALLSRWQQLRRFVDSAHLPSESEMQDLESFTTRDRIDEERKRCESEFEQHFTLLREMVHMKNPGPELEMLLETLERVWELRPIHIELSEAECVRNACRQVLRRQRFWKTMGGFFRWFRSVPDQQINRSSIQTSINAQVLENDSIHESNASDTIRVFVSHSSMDRSYVEREVVQFLNRNGIETWYSADDIEIASDWEERIQAGLKTCNWFLIVMSKNSANSPWVRNEVRWALHHMPGHVVPLMIDEVNPADFSLILQSIQHIDFRIGRSARNRLLQLWKP